MKDFLHLPAGVLGFPGFSSFRCPPLCLIHFLFMTCKSQNILDLGSWTFSFFIHSARWVTSSRPVASQPMCVLVSHRCVSPVLPHTHTTVCARSHSTVLGSPASCVGGERLIFPFKSAPSPYLTPVNSITIYSLSQALILTVTPGSSYSDPWLIFLIFLIPPTSWSLFALPSRSLWNPVTFYPLCYCQLGSAIVILCHVDYDCSIVIAHLGFCSFPLDSWEMLSAERSGDSPPGNSNGLSNYGFLFLAYVKEI